MFTLIGLIVWEWWVFRVVWYCFCACVCVCVFMDFISFIFMNPVRFRCWTIFVRLKGFGKVCLLVFRTGMENHGYAWTFVNTPFFSCVQARVVIRLFPFVVLDGLLVKIFFEDTDRSDYTFYVKYKCQVRSCISRVNENINFLQYAMSVDSKRSCCPMYLRGSVIQYTLEGVLFIVLTLKQNHEGT